MKRERVLTLSDAAGGIDIVPTGVVAFDLSFEGGAFSPELMAARGSCRQSNQ
jgi:hypothetical protein